MLPPSIRQTVCGAAAALALAGPAWADSAARSWRVPSDFVVTPAAIAPLVQGPRFGCFDDRGRLYVTETDGISPCHVRMLEDTDGDGVFDRSTIFADRIGACQGVLWCDGALYLTSAPFAWRLEDTNGDGRADSRRQIAADLGPADEQTSPCGPFFHPDGRLYWCLGSRGARTGADLDEVRLRSSRPDGSDVRIYLGGAIGEPAAAAVSEEGAMFGAVLQPASRAGAIVHWMHGGLVGRVGEARAPLIRSAVAVPAVAEFSTADLGGMIFLRTVRWGSAFLNNLIFVQAEPSRIMRLPLERSGSTFTGRPEVFVSAADPAVHFTALIEDADGSVLVFDAGGTAGADAARTASPGGIYRIRPRNTPAPADPGGAVLAWDGLGLPDLVARLGDARPAVRDRATSALAQRGDPAVPALTAALESKSPLVRTNAVWVLTRLSSPAARAGVRAALLILDARVRQAACISVSDTGDVEAAATLVARLDDDSPAVQREAAFALGRLRSPAALPALGGAAAIPRDDMLARALVETLIETDEPAEIRRLLRNPEPRARQAAAFALAGRASGQLGPVR